jgi:2-polyprenyl-3-methyl-5-hydroxy-6-metoxy-1,4-benzoquinol methylase
MGELKQFYESLPADFYENLKKQKANPLRNWFHRTRYELIRNWVNEEYKEGMTIIDIGCGTCAWNTEKLPVTGIDFHGPMLDLAKKIGHLNECVLADIYSTTLPNNYADLVIMSEVVEHTHNPYLAILEAQRILKPKGKILISVPYDIPLSMWYPLFNAQCIILGYLLNKSYYRDFGGHVQHFSPKTIKEMIHRTPLRIKKQFHHYRFTIYNICEKHE